MFIGIKQLEQGRLDFHEQFPPGTIDFRTREFRQAAVLDVEGSADLAGVEIHLEARLRTQLEMTCARCLEPLTQKVAASFDLVYRPVNSIRRGDEISLGVEDTDVGFYTGQGLFLADVLAEQVYLALPMKVLCRAECKGLCPHCGANLNRDRCRCAPRPVDPRLAPLAEWAAKKQSH
ncbi:MAG: YceD family protein [Candidatus Acidiferrales bacterium]